MSRPATYQGRVVDSRGRPATNALVMANAHPAIIWVFLPPPDDPARWTTRTDRHGDFAFTVKHAVGVLMAQAEDGKSRGTLTQPASTGNLIKLTEELP